MLSALQKVEGTKIQGFQANLISDNHESSLFFFLYIIGHKYPEGNQVADGMVLLENQTPYASSTVPTTFLAALRHALEKPKSNDDTLVSINHLISQCKYAC
ncbi:hypothetical protein V6N13_090721 [Hibiscus sabdariffa]|uniref:RNase H type-1 domain-containing protein n=1 Tax=Hibiscus sabdariffa TaxID=183260 RepID=A0ABR2BNT5_9ROSI